jgi:hypothetical protein
MINASSCCWICILCCLRPQRCDHGGHYRFGSSPTTARHVGLSAVGAGPHGAPGAGIGVRRKGPATNGRKGNAFVQYGTALFHHGIQSVGACFGRGRGCSTHRASIGIASAAAGFGKAIGQQFRHPGSNARIGIVFLIDLIEQESAKQRSVTAGQYTLARLVLVAISRDGRVRYHVTPQRRKGRVQFARRIGVILTVRNLIAQTKDGHFFVGQYLGQRLWQWPVQVVPASATALCVGPRVPRGCAHNKSIVLAKRIGQVATVNTIHINRLGGQIAAQCGVNLFGAILCVARLELWYRQEQRRISQEAM